MDVKLKTEQERVVAHALSWNANTRPGLRPFEFEHLTRAIFDISAASITIASADGFTAHRPDWESVSQAYRYARNDQLKVVGVRYSNPFAVDLELIEVTRQALIAAAAIGTLLVTGTALRRKYMAEARVLDAQAEAEAKRVRNESLLNGANVRKANAEAAAAEAAARKANAEAAHLEYDLEKIAMAARVEAERDQGQPLLPPEADGTWEDVAEVVGGRAAENDVDRTIGIMSNNAGLNRQIMIVRGQQFDVIPRD